MGAQILVGLVRSYRYDREVVDLEVANLEAAKLHEATKAKQLDHDDIVWILGTRNAFQLKGTFQCYKQNYGNPIHEVWVFQPTDHLIFSSSLFAFFFSSSYYVYFCESFSSKCLDRTSCAVAKAFWNLF